MQVSTYYVTQGYTVERHFVESHITERHTVGSTRKRHIEDSTRNGLIDKFEQGEEGSQNGLQVKPDGHKDCAEEGVGGTFFS